MKIAIEATDKIVDIDGVQCRLWHGTTESGVPCKLFVHRVLVHNDEDQSAFETELRKQLPPALPRVFDLRHIV